MRLLDLAGDRADRAVPGAERAALALVRIDHVLEELRAYAGGAALVLHVRDVLIPEILHRGEHGVRRGLAESAHCVLLDVMAEILHLVEVFERAVALDDLGEHLIQTAGADPARRALSAALVDREVEEEAGDVDHAVVLVHNYKSAGAHHGADSDEAVVVDRSIYL